MLAGRRTQGPSFWGIVRSAGLDCQPRGALPRSPFGRSPPRRRQSGYAQLAFPSAPSSGLVLDVRPIEKDLHLLQGDEPARHHRIKGRQERLDLGVRVDNLDDDGQILGKAEVV
jgi:hypothetical protein